MKIDIKHIADLARVTLSKAEEEKFSSDLDSILAYVEELKEVDASRVHPMAGGTELVNSFRGKGWQAQSVREDIIAGFPEIEEGFLKVPKIFE